MNRTTLGRILSAAVLFAGAARAFAGDVATDMELTGVNDIDVPSGETWTYSGVISGSGSIRKIGAGTLVLNNAANTFTGGITITNGVVRADCEGCLGTGDVLIHNAKSSTILKQLCLNAEGATFANFVRTTSGSDSNSRDRPFVRFMKNATLAKFYSYSNEGFVSVDSGVVGTFSESVETYPGSSGRRLLTISGTGRAILKGSVKVGTFISGGSSGATTMARSAY